MTALKRQTSFRPAEPPLSLEQLNAILWPKGNLPKRRVWLGQSGRYEER